MNIARYFHPATRLNNGKVLVLGGNGSGTGPNARAELYDPATNTWSSARSMAVVRDNPTATLLPNGKVLVVGGGGGGEIIPDAELYDPATNTWSSAGAPSPQRVGGQTATLLQNGEVLVAGGAGPYDRTAVLYNPASNSWSSAGSMSTPRPLDNAALLPDGRVLVTGGEDPFTGNGLRSAELYTPATNTWSRAGNMAGARFRHTETTLPNGKVLVAGGVRDGAPACSFEQDCFSASAEVYDPTTNRWSSAGSMGVARSNHTASLLPNGRVVVTGGDWSYGQQQSAEQYDPATNRWSGAGCMSTPRSFHTATVLQSGKLLVTGGYYGFAPPTGALASTELYSPTAVPPGSGCSVDAWGWNGDGETNVSAMSPGGAPHPYWLSVSAGFSGNAAVRLDGTVWTSGANALGQRGDGSTTTSDTLVQARGLTGVVAVSSGKSHVLALKSNGTVWSWGNNSAGQLGYGTPCGHDCAGSTVPRQVPGLSNVAQIAAGAFHSLALTRDGRLFAWGQGGQGQLGNGYLVNKTTPTAVPNLGGLTIKSISASVYDSMVVTTAGRLWGWGGNGYGEVRGDGKIGIRSTPLEVPIAGVAAVTQGTYFTVAVKTDGSVWTWGRNEHGQLGRGTVNVPTWDGIPKRVPGLAGITAASAGREFALALDQGGRVFAWGYGADGETGKPAPPFTDSATPTEVSLPIAAGLSSKIRARSISAGAYHAIVITP